MLFELHPQLAKDCMVVGDLPLCRVLLANDRQYPWLILVPMQNQIKEIIDLSESQQQQLWLESAQVSRALQTLFKPDKLNVAALGNMVPQLHLHHIARFTADAAWPAPIWGKHPAIPYGQTESDALITSIRDLLKL